MFRRVLSICALALLSLPGLLPLPALAQLSPSLQWAAEVEAKYNFAADVAYMTENGVELKLDIYSRRVVGWRVADAETAALFRPLLDDAVEKHNVPPGQLTLHADRGGSFHSPGVRFS